jgi:hypothetical protein
MTRKSVRLVLLTVSAFAICSGAAFLYLWATSATRAALNRIPLGMSRTDVIAIPNSSNWDAASLRPDLAEWIEQRQGVKIPSSWVEGEYLWERWTFYDVAPGVELEIIYDEDKKVIFRGIYETGRTGGLLDRVKGWLGL